MALTDLVSKIIVEEQFNKAFDDYQKRIDDADTGTEKFGATIRGFANIGAVIGGSLAAAAVGVNELVGKYNDLEQANTNLAVSVTAANKEFGDSVGTVDSWRQTVEETAKEVKLFSEREVAGASSRLVDMTKRLGFTEQQMEILLKRSADLAAGKTDLNGAIERVTSAMRGEAESAEFLGLSLGETQVRAYAEAHGLVFEKLTDTEKAQLRYAAFLEQTNELQGRAAVLAETGAGKQQALNAQYEDAAAKLGQQLLPLQQGYIEALGLLAGQSEQSGGIVTNVLAAIAAAFVTFGATAFTIITEQIAIFKSYGDIVSEVYQVITTGQGDIGAAIARTGEQVQESQQRQAKAITDYGKTFSDAFEQFRSEYTKLGQTSDEAITKLASGSEKTAQSFDQSASAAEAAAQEIADAYEKANEQRTRTTEQFTQRAAQLEFDHAQRVGRLQEELARATVEATEAAAADRLKAQQDYANDAAAIERDLASETTAAQAKLNSDLAQLRSERKQAEREYKRDIRDINADLESDLADLTFETGQKRNEITYDLEQERTRITEQAAQERQAAAEKAAQDRLAVEEDYQNQINQINDNFSSEFAEADPFRRKILEFNRQEELRQAEEQKNNQLAIIDEQEKAEIDAAQSKADDLIAIQEEQAAHEREILDQETAHKEEVLREQAERDRLAAQERLEDTKRELDERAQLLQESFAQEQAAREAAAAEARTALETQLAEELAKIDEQEQAKIQKAQEAIEREQQNYADRLASLQFAQGQELAEINSHLASIEQAERDSQDRRLDQASDFATEMQRLNALAFSGQSGGAGNNPGNPNLGVAGGTTVNVYNSGVPGGYPGASQTGRSVQDALRGAS